MRPAKASVGRIADEDEVLKTPTIPFQSLKRVVRRMVIHHHNACEHVCRQMPANRIKRPLNVAGAVKGDDGDAEGDGKR